MSYRPIINTALTSILALSASAFSAKALAEHSISGQVIDLNGKPIKNARVEVHGSQLVVRTDDNGQFFINEQIQHIEELHIVAKGFNHGEITSADDVTEYSIVLSPALIERIDVTATPLHASTLESATPISVLSDQDLKNKHTSTLGETLKSELGVHSSYYGPVSSTPIIRGLDGPRVLIAQNGLDASDASRVGPDHVVSTDSSTVKQIEVLRGPATLFYGSGAIGGVVNIVDNRVPREIEKGGDWQASYGSVADEAEFAGVLNGGVENAIGDKGIAWHIDAFFRESNDYTVPAYPIFETEEEHAEHAEESHEEHAGEEHLEGEEHHDEHDDAHHGDEFTLENSASRSKGANAGASILLDNGFVGFSFGYLDKLYGIPGHDHGSHDEHGDHEEGHEDHADEMHEEEYGHENHEGFVKGDMRQTRFQMVSELSIDHNLISGINTRFGITNYQHQELEFDGLGGVEVGTQFNNDSWQLRSDFLLADVNDWHGALSVDIKSSDFEAIGEEAFTPPSKTSSYAIGLLEEKHFGDVLWQLGARIESVTIESDVADFDFAPMSLSAGFVYDFTEGYNVAVSYTHSSRAPSSSEILSNGAHIGTNSFELGNFYVINSTEIEEETSNNIEFSLRKFEGSTGFVINTFYNQVNDFYYQANTGEEMDELPVFQYEAKDAEFYGVEAQWVWQANRDLKVTLQADSITGKLDSGEYLPRIPPARVGSVFNYDLVNTSFELSVMHNFEQDKVADLETHTGAYTMVDMNINHYFMLGDQDLTAYIKVNNIFDEAARVHSSFLKNDTLLPGRNIVLGLRGRF